MSETNSERETKPLLDSTPVVAPPVAPGVPASPESVLPKSAPTVALSPLAPVVRPPLSTVGICFHGFTGSSKTEQIRHLVKAFGADKVATISCEKGLTSVADVCPQHFLLLSPEEVEMYAGQPGKLLQTYLANLRRSIVWLQQNHKKLLWWACDAANEACSIMEQFDQMLMDAKKRFVSKKSNAPDPRKMYADIWLSLSKIFRDLQMLPLNGYINSLTLLDKEMKKDDSGEEVCVGVTKRPWLAGKKILDAYAPKWDATCYAYSQMEQSRRDPSMKIVRYFAQTQGNTEGFEKVVARTRSNPSRPIPMFIPLGAKDSNDKRYFNPKTDWSVVRLWSAMTGQTLPDYDPTEPGWGIDTEA